MTRTFTKPVMVIHCALISTEKPTVAVCGNNPEDHAYSSFMPGDIEEYCTRENKDLRNRTRLVPCEKCVNNPAYPLYILKEQKL